MSLIRRLAVRRKSIESLQQLLSLLGDLLVILVELGLHCREAFASLSKLRGLGVQLLGLGFELLSHSVKLSPLRFERSKFGIQFAARTCENLLSLSQRVGCGGLRSAVFVELVGIQVDSLPFGGQP